MSLAKFTLIALSTLVLPIAPTGARAATDANGEVRSIRVGYADLDLRYRPGADALLSRIRSAAHRVCELPMPGTAFKFSTEKERHCIERAIKDAVRDVGSPLLAERYSGRVAENQVTAR